MWRAAHRWRLIDAPFTLALAALLLPVAAPQAVEEGFPQQQPMGSQPQPPQQQSWGAWDPVTLPPQPAMEVPLPRMLVPGYGIFDMPTSDAYGPGGARAQPEAGEEDAASSYNATEIMGSLEGEIRRLEAQIKLSFHKEVSGGLRRTEGADGSNPRLGWSEGAGGGPLGTRCRQAGRQPLPSQPKPARAQLRHMRGHGLRDGAALLELGCGPGWSTLKFAQALPQARVTCVEVDERMVRRPHALAPCSPIGARPRARPHPRARPRPRAAPTLALAPPQVRAARELLAGHERVTVRHGLAQRTGLPSASFDFVTMRFLLQHLRRPSLVLREAMRLLRPGGGVAVVETDDLVGGVMDPLVPSLQPLNLKFSARQAQQGGSRFVGRHLLRMLDAAGFAERHVEAALAASDEFDEGVAVFAPHFDVTRFRVLVDEGQISAAEYDEAEAAIRAFLEEPASIAMMVNMVAHCPLAPLAPLAPSPPSPPSPCLPIL